MRHLTPNCLLLCFLWLVTPLHALELKFASPGDLSRSLTPVVCPTLLSVVNEEGGLLRFQSAEKQGFCQMGLTAYGSTLQQEDGEVSTTFRFGGDKESFGLYFHVTGDSEDAYLALVSIWTKGQGTVRLFRVPPRVQVEDHHQLAKENVRSPLIAGSWYTLKFKKAAQSSGAVQVTAELAPATGGAATVATAIDPSGLTSGGAVHVRFYAGDPGQKIDVKQITATPAAKPVGR